LITATHITTGGTHLVLLVGGTVKWVPVDVGTTSVLNSLSVLGGAGNDTFTVDNTAGPVVIPAGTFFDGGPGLNELILTGTSFASTDTYTPGPGAGAGADAQVVGGLTQLVTFANLTPMLDLTPGPLTVNGTNADNAINYTQGPNSGTAAVGL